jgi:hypothetical protein
MQPLKEYAEKLANRSKQKIKNGQLFAKVLTDNDDSGRHGVLIPGDVYSFFPHLAISNPNENATTKFVSFDAIAGGQKTLAFKYYERYPERRITCVNPVVNNRDLGKRLQIVLRGELPSGEVVYVHDAATEYGDRKFQALWDAVAGNAVEAKPGAYVVVPVNYSGITMDAPLAELLAKFDEIKDTWVDCLRPGDTGVGYTFETLLGIKENNDKTADFHGIELKCKQLKVAGYASTGKLNLFQQAPLWAAKTTGIERLRQIGQKNINGLFSCYSQVTTNPNNLLLSLLANTNGKQIDLEKDGVLIGHWLHETLEKRLTEKHSRAAFILASTNKAKTKFCYEQLIYCEQPAIDRFLDLVMQNQLVFEFLMSEKESGQVRNHGYPWRLNSENLLDQLFAVKARLR